MRLLPMTLFVLACGSDLDEADDHPEGIGGVPTNTQGATKPHDGDSDSDDDEDAPPINDGDDPEEDDRFWPVEGAWSIYDLFLSRDDCGLGDQVSGDFSPSATLFLGEARRFTMSHHFGTDHCELDPTESPFECGGRQIVDTTPRDDYGLDAEIVLNLVIDGVFEHEDSMTLYADLVATCRGTNCDLVSLFTGASFPCDMALELAAEAN